MANLPFSAPKNRSLPTINGVQDLTQVLLNWKTKLAPLVKSVAPQPTPLNFGVTSGRGGMTLSWSPVSGADGYEILKSANGSFTDDLQIIPVKNASQCKFFDSVGGNAQSASYKIRTTSGTAANPQSQRGPESGTVAHTSIDAADTKSVPSTKFDQFTSDKTRSRARFGNYGAIKQSPLGKSGGISVGSGTQNSASSPSGTPSSSSTSFSAIASGTNSGANLIVSAGSQIGPDPGAPGIVNATELQGTLVSTAAPTDGKILQYSAANGSLQFVSIIAVGTQANLSSVLPLALGKAYLASDTGNLFVGTPGIGVGYVQVGDMSQVSETLQQLVLEMRAARLALTKLACEGGLAEPADFEPQNLAVDPEISALSV